MKTKVEAKWFYTIEDLNKFIDDPESNLYDGRDIISICHDVVGFTLIYWTTKS